MKHNFYDTCSLLLIAEDLFTNPEETIHISSITLDELENIKTSPNKDPEIKHQASELVKLLDRNENLYTCHIFTNDMLQPITHMGLTVTDDTRILATAIKYKKEQEDLTFITNDLCLKSIAKLFFNNVDSVVKKKDDYCGYIEKELTEEEMAEFYSNPYINLFNLLINQYLIIINKQTKEPIDVVCWTGDEYRRLKFLNCESKWFGKVKPKSGDLQQQMVLDSFANNKLTLVKGPAGSGKTFLSLAFLFHLLDKGKIDKVVIFCNTVATKNSAKLGYYPGTRDEKLLDSQIGNMLISKFGSRIEVERLISEEKVILLPFSDIRGYDTSGMNAGIYISEAQNLDISLMRLALQRVGEDCFVIIDGDEKTQVDDISFAGHNNGMIRVSKVYRGDKLYGEIELQKIHRSRIGQIAERM